MFNSQSGFLLTIISFHHFSGEMFPRNVLTSSTTFIDMPSSPNIIWNAYILSYSFLRAIAKCSLFSFRSSEDRQMSSSSYDGQSNRQRTYEPYRAWQYSSIVGMQTSQSTFSRMYYSIRINYSYESWRSLLMVLMGIHTSVTSLDAINTQPPTIVSMILASEVFYELIANLSRILAVSSQQWSDSRITSLALSRKLIRSGRWARYSDLALSITLSSIFIFFRINPSLYCSCIGLGEERPEEAFRDGDGLLSMTRGGFLRV